MPFIGPSSTIGAVMPVSLRPATKVVVFQWPCGMPARRAAAQFEIGIATAIVWVRRARASGERMARRQGQPRRSKLDPQRDFLLGLVEQTPDMTIIEMQQRLAAERDIKASVGTIWTFLDRCGLTFKKSPRTRRSGIGPTS